MKIFRENEILRTIFICLFFTLAINVSCQKNGCTCNELAGKMYHGLQKEIEFRNDELDYFVAGEGEKTYKYKFIYEDSLQFIKLLDGSDRKWLIIFSDRIIFLYEAENVYPFFYGVSENPRAIEAMYFEPNVFTATSYLTEGTVSYLPENLGRPETRKPWVEGVEGNGIGQEITFERMLRSFWISIGFVHMIGLNYTV